MKAYSVETVLLFNQQKNRDKGCFDKNVIHSMTFSSFNQASVKTKVVRDHATAVMMVTVAPTLLWTGIHSNRDVCSAFDTSSPVISGQGPCHCATLPNSLSVSEDDALVAYATTTSCIPSPDHVGYSNLTLHLHQLVT